MLLQILRFAQDDKEDGQDDREDGQDDREDAQDDKEEVRRRGSGGAKIEERDEVGVVSILKQQQKFLFFIKI